MGYMTFLYYTHWEHLLGIFRKLCQVVFLMLKLCPRSFFKSFLLFTFFIQKQTSPTQVCRVNSSLKTKELENSNSQANTNITLDIHTGNLLEGIQDEQLLVKMLEDELSGNLSPRKDAGDRTIYTTRYFRESIGSLYLCDLGEAVVGNENMGPAMPTQYRAPEVILGMRWGHAIDMWSIGMMVRNFASNI